MIFQLGVKIMKQLQVQQNTPFSFVKQGGLKVNLLQIVPLKSGQIYVSWLSFGKSYHPRSMVEFCEKLPSSKQTKSKSYINEQKAVKDKLIVLKFEVFSFAASHIC